MVDGKHPYQQLIDDGKLHMIKSTKLDLDDLYLNSKGKALIKGLLQHDPNKRSWKLLQENGWFTVSSMYCLFTSRTVCYTVTLSVFHRKRGRAIGRSARSDTGGKRDCGEYVVCYFLSLYTLSAMCIPWSFSKWF